MNRLSIEKSPYLLQHQNNPVAWYPWGPEVFALAKSQDKPIFLSIGYSTCHWCHVMAHESFEDAEVAQSLNENFVCIKVDREERPDVDALYMKALQAISGGGGWPMSVWLTPEGKPFFAGTYYPKYRFVQLLRRISGVWREQRSELLKDSEQLLTAVARSDSENDASSAEERRQVLAAYTNHFMYVFDEEYAGFGSAPKFPQTMNLMLMMRHDFRTGLRLAEPMVMATLTAMLRGGIYDHLRGGFHRYSVDRQWLVPHFEKMLYDQALISVTLLEAYLLYGRDSEVRRALTETLDYVVREMQDPGGGFYSAQDADSFNPQTGHGEEGFFATYTYAELKAALTPDELQALGRVYGVAEGGQFEGRNILHLQEGMTGAEKQQPVLSAALKKLELMRSQRQPPHLDDKIVTAWNGWMIWALAKAGRHLGEERFSQAAQQALKFVREKLYSGNRLRRYYRQGQACAPATAEDYTALIMAALEVGGQETWIVELQSVLDSEFVDTKNGGYFTDDGQDTHLPLRTKDEYDGVHPSANSMAAFNLSQLYLLTGEARYRDQADKIFSVLFAQFKQSPSSLAFLGLALDYSLSDPRVIIAQEQGWSAELKHEQNQKFSPYQRWLTARSRWPVAADKEGDVLYVCLAGRCLAPASDAQNAISLLNSH